MNNPNRSIRAPSTIIKSSNPRTYNGPLAQNKFKLLGSLGLNPLLGNTPQTNTTQPTTTTASTTSRIPSKPSGLIKPTPVRHIISAASTTSSSSTIKQPIQRPLSSSRPTGSGSKLTELRLQSAKSVSARKPTALITTNTQIKSPQQQQQQPKQTNQYVQSDTVTSSASSSIILDVSVFNSISDDVGDMRQSLKQVVALLQGSNQDTKEFQKPYAILEAENEQLRRENAELKCKLRAIKSTVIHNRDSTIPEESETHRTIDGRPTNSDLFFTPLH